MKMKVTGIAIAAVSVMVLASCGADPDSPGLEYMPDMYRSAAIEPYVDYGEIRGEENMEAKMMISAKVPPFGTVPYYGTDSATVALMLPYAHKPNVLFKETHGLYGIEYTTEDSYLAAAADVNPYKLTEENAEEIFAKGKYLFESRCMHCHGKAGDGQGPMMLSGAYTGVPDYGNLKALSDGQMFYSIYYGRNMMGSHGSILNKKEIWTLVHYIRKFQFKDYGPGFVMGAPATEAPVDAAVVVPPAQ